MRQLFLDKGNLVVKELAQPLLHDYSVLVSIHFAYISQSTNLSLFNEGEGFLSNVPHKIKRVLEAVAAHAVVSSKKAFLLKKDFQSSFGYACSGHVIAVGKKVKKLAPGDYVACVDPGSSPYTDLICIPEQCAVKINNKKYLKEASLTTLAARGMQALRRAQVQIGETICVLGLDAVGLLIVQLAKQAGCRVIGIDTEQSRIDLAKSLGCSVVYNFQQDDVEKEIDLLSERHGVDTVFISYQSAIHAQTASNITRNKGKIVLLDAQDALFQAEAMQKDIDVLFSGDNMDSFDAPCTSFSDKRWTTTRNMQACLELIESEKLHVSLFTQEQIDYKQIKDVYQRIEKKQIVGCVLSYDQFAVSKRSNNANLVEDPQIKNDDIRFVPAVSDLIRVGMLGMGDFAQKFVIPEIDKLKQVCLYAVADSDMNKAMPIAKKYNVAKAATKLDDLFVRDSIDAVVISSSYAFHVDLALKALQNGKAVLLEKPMATDFFQLQRLCSFLEKHKQVPFAVNYGLSSSPFAQKIKKMVIKRKTPIIAHYRINREFFRKEQRVHGEMGAGRIIGDACQIVDLFCYLVGGHPVSISVEAMHSSRDDIFPTDNFTAHMSFSDGSVCSFLYTTLGHIDMGSDRMELFYDGKSILMQDYKELYGFGLSSWFNETLSKPDRGYELFISDFFNSLQTPKKEQLIDVEYLRMVAEVTLFIDKLACEGGGKKEL